MFETQTVPRPAKTPRIVFCALAFLAGLFVVALLSSFFVGPSDIPSDLRARLEPPLFFGGSWAHPLGTDELGRDMLMRLLVSIRTSLLVATLGTLIGAVLGTAVGMVAASYGGIVDDALMTLVDVQASLPFIIIALAVIAFAGPGFWLFILVVGLYGWERYARIARSLTLSAQESGYARATAHLGGGSFRIYVRHILPNIASALLVALTINFPETMLLETSLSFLGLGVQPPDTSLGTMIGDGRTYLVTAWWIAVVPGVVLSLSALSASLVGDWCRDVLDPVKSP